MMSREVTTIPDDAVRVVPAQANVFNPETFTMLDRVATAMSRSSMLPEHLTHAKEGSGQSAKMVRLDSGSIYGNCFMVATMASNWGMNPFAVAQATSLVHGRLCFEGKLVAAVLDAMLRVRLHYQFGKWDPTKAVTDITVEGTGDDLAIRVSELGPDGKTPTHRYIDGCVKMWRTSGTNTPWTPDNFRRQLRYRGAREFARAYEPAAMLGVYTPDEFDDVTEAARASRARPIGGNTEEGHNPLLPKPDAAVAEANKPGDAQRAAEEQKARERAAQEEARARQADRAAKEQASEKEKTGDPNAPRLADGVLRNYGDLLKRYENDESLRKAAADFWSKNGNWPPPNQADFELARSIMDAHKHRVAGIISMDDAIAHVDELLSPLVEDSK
jgi:hypothetical protein